MPTFHRRSVTSKGNLFFCLVFKSFHILKCNLSIYVLNLISDISDILKFLKFWTFENQIKKRFPLLVTLLLWKVGNLAQNMWHIKITEFSMRTSGYLPFITIIYNISDRERYVKTFLKTTFSWNQALLRVIVYL